MVVARELTKLHEEVLRGSARELLEALPEEGPRGEVVLLFAPTEEEAAVDEEIVDDFLKERLAAGERPRQAAKAAAARFGMSSREAYERVLSLDE